MYVHIVFDVTVLFSSVGCYRFVFRVLDLTVLFL